MLDFNIKKVEEETYLETSITGKLLLTTPQLNKGTAFTKEERRTFNLLGKLPHRVETLETQVDRAYAQFENYSTALQKNIYLNNLHDKNQTLFYKLVSAHLAEMIPIIYTPIVGLAVQKFSREYRQARGLYISYEDKDLIDEILKNRSNPNIELIVVTDGERVLGIGDQGIGGMDIPVAKLMMYSVCGGIDPTKTLPIFLDVGTCNEELLKDPLYLGYPFPRIRGKDYDDFIEHFVERVQANFPNVFLHWEDFSRANARRILEKYQDKLCTFNDDIQGTGAVTLAALLAYTKITKLDLTKQKIVVFGAGSAGTGISDQIVEALLRFGLSKEEAYDNFFLIDRQGLLLENDLNLTAEQSLYAKKNTAINAWAFKGKIPSLHETIVAVKPAILIGCSAQLGAFTKDIIEAMCEGVLRPAIFPLSNPDDKCEAKPIDILNWSKGKALIATGTAFAPVEYNGKMYNIAQCNNALVFPGIGLGVTAIKAKTVSSDLLWRAVDALADYTAKREGALELLPNLAETSEVAREIGIAIANSVLPLEKAKKLIESLFWQPYYLPYKLKK